MGQRVLNFDSYSEEAKKESHEIFDNGDVILQDAIAQLNGGGETVVNIPKLIVDGESATAEGYQELRRSVTEGDRDPEEAGQLYGETMNALEMRMASYGDLGDFEVAVVFPNGTVERSYDNVLGGSEGEVQDLMGDWAQALEENNRTPEGHPAYEMARSIGGDIEGLETY